MLSYFSFKINSVKDKQLAITRKVLCKRFRTKPEVSLSNALAFPVISVPPFDENRARLASLTWSNDSKSFHRFRVLKIK